MTHLTKVPCLVIGRAVSHLPTVSFIQGSNYIVLFQKIRPPQKGLTFPEGVGLSKTKKLNEVSKA